MLEYYRRNWTFHAKGACLASLGFHPAHTSTTGLWIAADTASRPHFTLIGSPNYGFRSVYRDLEAQVAITTTDPGLQEQLQIVIYSILASLVNVQHRKSTESHRTRSW